MQIKMDKPIIQAMCRYATKTRMIPKARFVFDSKLGIKVAVLSQTETPRYQREVGVGICRNPDSNLSLTNACEGTRSCDIRKCEEGATSIGSFHTHPSTAPLPSYADFTALFSNRTSDPQVDCIGGYVTPRHRKVVCLTSFPPFHGVREDFPYWEKDFLAVSYYDGREQRIELYMTGDQREAALKNGLAVLRNDPRFKVSVFDCNGLALK